MKNNWIEFIVGLKSESISFKGASNPFRYKTQTKLIKEQEMFVKPHTIEFKNQEINNGFLIETHPALI